MTGATAAIEEQRLRLIRVTQADGLDVRRVLRLARGELDTLAGCSDDECRAYACALLTQADRRAGRVPFGWIQRCHCSGCGPVWLWPDAPATLIACPWCWNRKEGLPVPCPLDAP